MARRHTSLGDRLMYVVSTGLVKAQGTTVTIYTDAAATTPANLAYFDPTDADTPGSAVTGGVLAVDAYSLRQGFWDLGDLSVLYMVGGDGPAVPIYPDPQPQIDDLVADVAGPPVLHADTHDIDGTDVLSINQSQVRGLSDALTSVGVNTAVYYLDAYNDFFTAANVFVDGQGNTATTLTAQATAGTTTLAVASATGLIVGTVLVLHPGTANQQLVRVTAVASLNLTVTPAVGTTLAINAEVSPLWTNASHLTFDPYGSKAYGYFVANAQVDGDYVITGSNKTVVWLGDSWTAQALIGFEVALEARIGPTTVVNAGVAGNRLDQMIARFDTDVAPHEPDYVIVEHGVNDIYQAVNPLTLAGYVDQVVQLCQAIGAIAVFPGIVPLSEYPVPAATRQVEIESQLSSPVMPYTTMGLAATRFGNPGVSPTVATNLRFGGSTTQPSATGANNIAVGAGAQAALTSGAQNSTVGSGTQAALTTGVNNTCMGYQAQNKITTPNYNTAMGQAAQFNLTIGGFNTGMGGLAQFGLTTGVTNTAMGYGAQYSPAGTAANATTTGAGQTCIGYQTGQGGTSQLNQITTVGYQAIANGNFATAIGANTSAGALGAVAIGCDGGGTGASTSTSNEIALGTSFHTTKIVGGLKLAAGTTARPTLNAPHGVAPTSPTDGDIWTTTAGLYVRINGATVGPLS